VPPRNIKLANRQSTRDYLQNVKAISDWSNAALAIAINNIASSDKRAKHAAVINAMLCVFLSKC